MVISSTITTRHNDMELFPFSPHYFTTREGFKLHYVDENPAGERCMLMLHGNPTWSFMYRKLIADAASAGWRAIALDNLGSGLSDKPSRWSYHLEGHIQNLTDFIEGMHLQNVTLVMHDWGGAIGMGFATRFPEKVATLVLMNTAAFPSMDFPKRIYLCHIPLLGQLLVQGCNLLMKTALSRAVAKPLPQAVKDGYQLPYQNWHDRVALLKYPQDIPLNKRHPSYSTLAGIRDALPLLASKPILLLWGEKDFCLHTGFLRIWQKYYPHAKTVTFPDAAHFLLEDEPEQTIKEILNQCAN